MAGCVLTGVVLILFKIGNRIVNDISPCED